MRRRPTGSHQRHERAYRARSGWGRTWPKSRGQCRRPGRGADLRRSPVEWSGARWSPQAHRRATIAVESLVFPGVRLGERKTKRIEFVDSVEEKVIDIERELKAAGLL